MHASLIRLPFLQLLLLLAWLAACAMASEPSPPEDGLAAAPAVGPSGAPVLALPPIPASDPVPPKAQGLPLSLHVRVADGVCEPLLRRGVELPAASSKLFTTTTDSQGSAHIELYVGERSFCDGNAFLTRLELAPLPTPSYRSFVQLEVAVDVDSQGIVRCRATEVESRALGDPYCEAEWSGDLLAAGGAPPGGGRDGREVALFSHALAKHLPVLLASRSVRFLAGAGAGRDVVIRQHQRREEEKVGTGGVLWEAAIVLADYVGRNAGSMPLRGKRVLELGAGTGLVAIAAAIEGAEVVATDGNPKVLEGAQRNVDAAGSCAGTVHAEVFDWNSEADLARVKALGPWDVIVGSDLVYPGNAGRLCVESNEICHPADVTLVGLFEHLAGPQTEVVLALKDRTGEVDRFLHAVERQPGRPFTVQRAPRESIMPEFRDAAAVSVMHLRRGPAPDGSPNDSPQGTC